MKENQTFGQAIEALNEGHVVSRKGWNGKDMFVFKQVPSIVPIEVIGRMTSLPQDVKNIFAKRGIPLEYRDQFAIVYPDNKINGWSPSTSDALAKDWRIHESVEICADTVGTALPIKAGE